MNTPLTTEERFWAVLSHLSSLAFGLGILLPILGWSEGRRKSKYISFHCLQALGYQSLGYTVWLLAYLLILIIVMGLVIVMSFRAEASGQAFDPLDGSLMALTVASVSGFLILYSVLPVIAAIACAFGRDYRYPILGHRLAAYLDYDGSDEAHSLNADHEERWVAAMGHFSVIIALWGLLAPLSAWILQGRQSPFLKFQAVQTTVYQAFVNLLYVVAGVFYGIGVIIVFSVLGLEGNADIISSAGMAGLMLFFVTLLLAALIILAVPLFHILGQWAGYRVLKGEDYRYPLIGRLVDRWMAKP
jgi:uncharacterized Tic20 family protein